MEAAGTFGCQKGTNVSRLMGMGLAWDEARGVEQ